MRETKEEEEEEEEEEKRKRRRGENLFYSPLVLQKAHATRLSNKKKRSRKKRPSLRSFFLFQPFGSFRTLTLRCLRRQTCDSFKRVWVSLSLSLLLSLFIAISSTPTLKTPGREASDPNKTRAFSALTLTRIRNSDFFEILFGSSVVPSIRRPAA